MVLLGAGSTIHANAPSTGDVTAYITGLKNPVVEAVVKGLTNQRALPASISNMSYTRLKSSTVTFFVKDIQPDPTFSVA